MNGMVRNATFHLILITYPLIISSRSVKNLNSLELQEFLNKVDGECNIFENLFHVYLYKF